MCSTWENQIIKFIILLNLSWKSPFWHKLCSVSGDRFSIIEIFAFTAGNSGLSRQVMFDDSDPSRWVSFMAYYLSTGCLSAVEEADDADWFRFHCVAVIVLL